mmetsp:Transcript_18846/g.38258  ORF Transcript_18846/g.38258 Transcript_18846/m.38258 type:complete len:106 (-) Transcript_18846:121-438(-)
MVERSRANVHRKVEEELGQELQDLNEEDRAAAIEEVAELLVGALNSSKIWEHAGVVTGLVASKIVFDNWKDQKEKRDAQAKKRQDRADAETLHRRLQWHQTRWLT